MGGKYLGYRYRVSNKNMRQKDDEHEQLEELLGEATRHSRKYMQPR